MGLGFAEIYEYNRAPITKHSRYTESFLMSENIVPLDQLGMNDVPRVGGKNASLGEMISNLGGLGVEVPDGFATTAHAFDEFLDQAGIRERIHQRLDRLDTDDVKELALAGAEIRG